jgi:hypothetical protein
MDIWSSFGRVKRVATDRMMSGEYMKRGGVEKELGRLKAGRSVRLACAGSTSQNTLEFPPLCGSSWGIGAGKACNDCDESTKDPPGSADGQGVLQEPADGESLDSPTPWPCGTAVIATCNCNMCTYIHIHIYIIFQTTPTCSVR